MSRTPDPFLLQAHRVDATRLPDNRAVHVGGNVEQRRQAPHLRLIKPAPLPEGFSQQEDTMEGLVPVDHDQRRAVMLGLLGWIGATLVSLAAAAVWVLTA